MAVGDEKDQRQRTPKKLSTNAQHPTNNADIKDWPNSGGAPRARRTRKSQVASAETPKSRHEQQQRQLGGCLSAPRCVCAFEGCSRHFCPSGQAGATQGTPKAHTKTATAGLFARGAKRGPRRRRTRRPKTAAQGSARRSNVPLPELPPPILHIPAHRSSLPSGFLF